MGATFQMGDIYSGTRDLKIQGIQRGYAGKSCHCDQVSSQMVTSIVLKLCAMDQGQL